MPLYTSALLMACPRRRTHSSAASFMTLASSAPDQAVQMFSAIFLTGTPLANQCARSLLFVQINSL